MLDHNLWKTFGKFFLNKVCGILLKIPQGAVDKKNLAA